MSQKNVNMSQIKPIEMVMISTDGQAYVKLHRYLNQTTADWDTLALTARRDARLGALTIAGSTVS